MMIGILGHPVFQEAEFEVGGREFKVTKLGAMEGYKMFMEHVRPCFGAFKGLVSSVSAEEMEEMSEKDRAHLQEKQFGEMMDAFAKIEYVHLEAMRNTFFRHCVGTKNSAGQWVSFASNPDEFTIDLSPAHIMVVMLRAFARNFGESAAEFGHSLGAMMGPADYSQTSPTHSSTPESAPDSSPTPTSQP